GDADAIGKLIEAGADIAELDTKKRSPLHIAAYALNENTVRVLAKVGPISTRSITRRMTRSPSQQSPMIWIC
ncbi:MAG: ankyrin repeat domain-containing protein, partial [Rhizobiaceae bacterium]